MSRAVRCVGPLPPISRAALRTNKPSPSPSAASLGGISARSSSSSSSSSSFAPGFFAAASTTGAAGRRVAVCAGNDDEGASGDEPSSFPQSTESLFMQELRRRGVSKDGTKAPPSGFGEQPSSSSSGGTDPFGSSGGGGSTDPFGSGGGGVPGTGPLNSATVGNDPLLTEDQLEKSRKLNSEGLEGLIPRASELFKLGGSQFLAFLPFMGVGVVLFVGCYFVLGTSFIHGGTTASAPPPYVDPYMLLDEPTYDPMVPLQ